MVKAKPKRYNLLLTTRMYRDIRREAKARDITPAKFIRQCILWGMVTMKPQTIPFPDPPGESLKETHE